MKLMLITILTLISGGTLYAQSEVADTLATQQLNEVVVNGEKPQVKSQDGILVVDLPGIVKDKPVTNILEALGYLPGVVNNNGMYGLAGASEVTIILNGELTNMPVSNLYQLLYSTPIDRLKTVEVMYAAPAKYHVNGAVINVVLKTPTPLDGLQGEARLGYNQAHYGSYGATLAATYAIKDWTFDLNYSLTKAKGWNNEQSFSNHLYNGNRQMIEDDSRRSSSTLSNLIYAAAGYKNFKLKYNGQITSYSYSRNLTLGNLGDFLNDVKYHSPVGYHNVTAKYTAPFGLTVGGDFTHYFEHRTQHLFSLPSDTETVIATNRQRINRYHAYVDQEHDIKGWQLGYGVEYQHSDDRSSQLYERPQSDGFNGVQKEDVADFYVSLQHSFPFGLSFAASGKMEYYHNLYRHNWNFIPQLGATYYKTPTSIFQLSFNAEREYPSYWELRGGSSYLNGYSEILGTPALQPFLNYSGQFSYIFKQKYVATLYVQYGDKATVQLPYQSPDELKLIYQTINMNFKRTVGLNLNVPFKVGYVWNATATANVFNQREKADHFHSLSFDNKKWIFYGGLNNTIRFTENCPVSLSVDFSYISPSIQGIADLSSMWKVDAGVKWQFGKKRCCELDLKADDIFNKWSPTLNINSQGQDYRMKVRDMTRNLRLTFIWRFNGFKPKDTSADTSRFGTGK